MNENFRSLWFHAQYRITTTGGFPLSFNTTNQLPTRANIWTRFASSGLSDISLPGNEVLSVAELHSWNAVSSDCLLALSLLYMVARTLLKVA